MAPLLAQAESANIFTYFGQSNVAGKVIILLLMVFSLVAWTVMLGKYLDLARMRKLNQSFEARISEVEALLAVGENTRRFGRGPYARLVAEALEAFYRFGGDPKDDSERQAKLRMGHVENALHRSIAEQTHRYESKMVLLASIVTGAPFLGLLGTVWGVMDAFGAMALRETATLQNLAPGVSGALLTTVAGLVVAIPSVFGYNFLLTFSKQMITELENFASTVADRIELEMG
ncbi:MAG: MotA/TolQ/ExbB proton channel family protein [Verrucomicrobiota bacterium]